MTLHNPDPAPAAPKSITLSLADASALGQGSVWSEMGILQQVEAMLLDAVAEAQSTGQPTTRTIVVNPA